MPEFTEIEVPFAPGTNVRDLLVQPHLAAYQKESMVALVVGPKRLADIMSFLHKPASKPSPFTQLPSASIFRGMIFGHIAVYTSKGVDDTTGVVFARPQEATQARFSAPAAGASPPAPVPPPSTPQERFKVQMVGMPSKAAAQPTPPKPRPPATSAGPGDFFSQDIPPRKDSAPSEDKLNRWTELIPSGTRIRKPKYQQGSATVYLKPGEIPLAGRDGPPLEEEDETAPQPQVAAPPPDHPARDDHDALHLAVDKQPAELPSADRVRLAKEADRLIYTIIAALEGVVEAEHEEGTDLVTEMRMLQLELDKYKPGIVRITEMIMNVSGVKETQEHVARLKECLRGLGLLL